jgi:hypothetical protein
MRSAVELRTVGPYGRLIIRASAPALLQRGAARRSGGGRDPKARQNDTGNGGGPQERNGQSGRYREGPVEDWGKLLGDVIAVTAILDRILHHGHVLKCGPRSWRTKTAAAVPQPDSSSRPSTEIYENSNRTELALRQQGI